MNKSELISKVAEKSGLQKKQATAAIEAFVETVEETLAKGEKIQIIGFGNFEVRERAARKGCNPQTNEVIEIAASKVPAFKAGKAFKDVLYKLLLHSDSIIPDSEFKGSKSLSVTWFLGYANIDQPTYRSKFNCITYYI